MQLIGNNLYADEGKWLYRGDGKDRNFWKSVTLARLDNAQYYKECTQEEYDAWQDEYNPQPEPTPEPEPETQEAEIVNE